MMSLAVMALLATPLCGADSLQDRIVSNDPSSYRIFHKAHGGAGALMFQGLLESSALETNFLFLHAGQVLPNSSIGHHFHHTMEEMYVILDGEAEFTINGRTARLKAPVAVPCRMGQSHGIYNPTARSIAWLNFCVSSQKDKSDALDLGDDRVGAALDPKPVFVSVRLDRELLSPIKRFRGGEGTVLYRRALNADVFRTSWAYVDQLMIPPGASTGPQKLQDLEEVYYVIGGSGKLTVNGEQVKIKTGDAVPIRLGEAPSFTNESDNDLELLFIGIAKEN